MTRLGRRLTLLQSAGQIRFYKLSLAWEIEDGGRTVVLRVEAIQTTLVGEVILVGWQVCGKIGLEIGRGLERRQPIRRAEVTVTVRSSPAAQVLRRIETSSIS